jgi:RimJ/RimL family protein N-acetyltransferase
MTLTFIPASTPDPHSGLPIGLETETHPAPRPERVTIEGHYVRLEPLDPSKHTDDLYAASHGDDKHIIWQYLFEAPFASHADFKAHIERKAASEDPLFFAIIDKASGKAVGYETLMRIDTVYRVIEVGNIMYGSPLQKTPGATEAQYLLMRYVFDELGYRRYEWKCNSLNAPSRRAAERFGFSFEGIFRSHMMVRGRNRDTAWYSILEDEWPKQKKALEAWLSPDNFDVAGQQKKRLNDFK